MKRTFYFAIADAAQRQSHAAMGTTVDKGGGRAAGSRKKTTRSLAIVIESGLSRFNSLARPTIVQTLAKFSNKGNSLSGSDSSRDAASPKKT